MARKKPDDFDTFMDTEVRHGIRCRTCALYPKDSEIGGYIRRWLEAKRNPPPDKNPPPSRNYFHKEFLVRQCGYSLGVTALANHIDHCLGGGGTE